MWVNGNTQIGQQGSSSAKTTPLVSFTSHTISLSSKSRGKPCLVHFLYNIHGAQDDAIKHVEHPHKTRMQILSPGANISTSRDKFSPQAIFSYHSTGRLWQHICLKEYVIPGELSVWVHGKFRIGQNRSSSAKTTPRGSFTSHTISLSSNLEGNPVWSLLVQCPWSPG